MLSFRSSLKIFLLVLTFLLLFSTTVFANDIDDIKYVFYEDDSIMSRVYVVNYQDALDEDDLYEKVADGVYDALINNNQVWLETKKENVIDYSKAMNNHKSYNEVYEDSDYFTERPDPDYEYYYEDGNVLRRRDPLLDEPEEVVDEDYPNWLVVLDDDTDDEFKYHLETWEPISGRLFVEIEINREIFAEEVSSRNIRNVRIDGNDATRKETDDNTFRWFVGIKVDDLEGVDAEDMPQDNVFELKPDMVEVEAGIYWY